LNEKAPLKLYEKEFCEQCSDKEYCNTKPEKKQLCILTLVAKELLRIRIRLTCILCTNSKEAMVHE